MDRRAIGARAEDAAARALEERGYRVVGRNLRSRAGEIDLVCRDGDVVVFCEVKARRPSRFGVAAEALTAAKRARLQRLAAAYLLRLGARELACRLELVAVELDADGAPVRVEVVPIF